MKPTQNILVFLALVILVLAEYPEFSEYRPYEPQHIPDGGFIYDYLLLPLSSNFVTSGSYFTATDGMRDFH